MPAEALPDAGDDGRIATVRKRPKAAGKPGDSRLNPCCKPV